MNNDPSSSRSKHHAQHQKQQVQLRTMHRSKESFKKSTLKDRLDSMVTQRRKNVESKTKVDAIERLLSNNKKRLRSSYVLIRK
jgi:hypothetical protein